jgi:glutathionylspermidine synthase
MGVPKELRPLIESSWEQDHPTIYGRFDLACDLEGQIKMLEYNADTPTALLEAAAVQWRWLEETRPEADQFNAIHERLIDAWKWMKENVLFDSTLHFASLEDIEDEVTVLYMMDVASQAGVQTNKILLNDIGWDETNRRFVDLENRPITSIFKLYPWEWLTTDSFWPHLRNHFSETIWIEPAWKTLLSCKGILPILWEINPDHPLLLEAYFNDPGGMKEHVRKPLFSREGANITITTSNGTISTEGDYGEEGCVYQAFARTAEFDGHYPIIGSWIIGDEACGIGVRESDTPITDNRSRFIPHFFQ